MWWLWILGPVSVAAIYLLTGQQDKRRLREVETWRTTLGPKPVLGPRDKKPKGPPGTRRVNALPAPLAAVLAEMGGGEAVGFFELAPRIAYLAVMGANVIESSDYQAVVARLERPGPSFTVRPLPIVDGAREPNTGIQFAKDPAFMELFLVEGEEPKRLHKWLTRSLRKALLELPDAWLAVDGEAMAVALFGRADAARLDALVAAADAFFAEHGAEGGPSLLGDDEERDEETAAGEEDEDGDEDEAEEGDDGAEDDGAEDEEVAARKPPPVKSAPSKSAPAQSAPPKSAPARSTLPKSAPAQSAPPKGEKASVAAGAAKPASRGPTR